jgi:dTDP-4-amino-4,6-dideoxygalactose transaminase
MTGCAVIPFTGLARQYTNLRTEILDATDEVLRSGRLMDGNFTAQFEDWLARRNGTKYAVTCHSGTQALEIIAAYYATQHNMPNPPRVLIPAVTYVATANAFMRAGWDVHFVDVDANGIFDLRAIPDINYQAMVLVGLYGASIRNISDTRTWRRTVLQDGLVIEDAAQHWLSDGNVRIGHAAAISFDPMKNLAAHGNGGAIVSNDAELYRYALGMRNNGKPDHHHAGTNSRMSELDCAVLLVKTRYINQWQKRRGEIARFWMERFQNVGIRCLITPENWSYHCYHKFVIDVEHRDTLHADLGRRGIETRVHYAQPLHEIDIYRQWPGPSLLSTASALCRRVLSLPIYPELTDLEVEHIADQVLDCVIN